MRLWPPISWFVVRFRTMPPRSPNFTRLFLKASNWVALHGFRGLRVLGARSARVVRAAVDSAPDASCAVTDRSALARPVTAAFLRRVIAPSRACVAGSTFARSDARGTTTRSAPRRPPATSPRRRAVTAIGTWPSTPVRESLDQRGARVISSTWNRQAAMEVAREDVFGDLRAHGHEVQACRHRTDPLVSIC